MEIYCDKCKDYSNFPNGTCEICHTDHPAKQNYSPKHNICEEAEYDGISHDSDCFWID